jgi:acyl-coenzyme A synthetase/AMP-(fatty) acid ligase
VQPSSDAPVVVAVSLRSDYANEPADGRLEAEIRDLVDKHLQEPVEVGDIMVFEEIPRSVQGKVLHREVRGAISAEGGTGAA